MKFLSYVQNRESNRYGHYCISNIGTILDRVPRYSNYEQLFSAGIDEIVGNDFSYKINDIPKGLIKLCIDGKCHIMFLRKKSNPKSSLVTIEIRNNHIVQAKRRFNNDVTTEDQKAIDSWNKKFADKKEKEGVAA